MTYQSIVLKAAFKQSMPEVSISISGIPTCSTTMGKNLHVCMYAMGIMIIKAGTNPSYRL